MSVAAIAAVAGHKPQEKSLYLTGRSLTALPELHQTQELYAAANRLVDVTSLRSAAGLLLADLSWNHVEQVPGQLPLTLVSLDLSHNRLCDLTATLAELAKLPKLRILHLKGNPFCLQPSYLSAVQQALPLLQHFDGSKAWPMPPPLAASSATSPNSLAADAITNLPASSHQHLHICFSQLCVHNTGPGLWPVPCPASEAAPPAYYYYLQQRTAEGSVICSFPVVLTPQDELAQWQAQQTAEAVKAGKKAASKKAPAGKGGKGEADASEQQNAWYPQGSLTAAVPIAADTLTTDWLQSGMTLQLFQVRASPPTPSSSISDLSPSEVKSAAAMQRCVARAVLQPHPLLDGVTRDWSIKLGMLAELPLFDARGARTAVQDAEHNVAEVASVQVQVQLLSQ